MTRTWQVLGFVLVLGLTACVATNSAPCGGNETYCAASNSCIPTGYPCVDGCPSHLQQCEQVMLQGVMCANLDSICPTLAYSPSNLSDTLAFHSCSSNHSLCPLTAECTDQGQPCNLTIEYHGLRNISHTPWGTNCSSADHYFCPLLMRCVHINISCSYEVLHQWILSGNMAVGPYGTVCGAEEKYCLANSSCIPINGTCEIMLPHNGSLDDTCYEGERFCPALLRCVHEGSYNMSCAPLGPLNFSASYDNGTGWLPFCEMGTLLCPRILYGVSQCHPIVKKCTEHAMYRVVGPLHNNSNFSQPGTGPGPPDSSECNGSCPINCTEVERRCEDVDEIGEVCEGLDRICGYLSDRSHSCTVGGGHLNTVIDTMIATTIRMTMTLTPGMNSIVPTVSSGSTNLSPDSSSVTSSAGSGSVGPASSSGASLSVIASTINSLISATIDNNSGSTIDASSTYTPAMASSFSGGSCNGSGSDEMRLWLDFIRNITTCNNGHKYCPLNLHCIPDASPCTVNLTSSVMANSSRTPWGTNCSSADQYFCPLFMKCIDVNETCSYRALYHWYLSGNTSYGPFGQVCGVGERFCFLNNICIPNNDTCDVTFPPNNSSLNGSKFYCEQGEFYCPFTLSCVNDTQPCNPLQEFNYAYEPEHNVNTSGWVPLCQMRNLICPRVAYGMFRCESSRRYCGFNRTTRCPEGSSFCESNGSCIPHQMPCCLMNETFCQGGNLCLPFNETCCPQGEHYCESNGSCIPLQMPCCLMNETFCSSSNECLPLNETCCSQGEHYCESNGSCIPLQMLCCLMNETFCSSSSECLPLNETCCSQGEHYCESNGSCIPLQMPCCLMNETFCSEKNACLPLNETCLTCLNGTRFCESNGSCIPDDMYCCLMNETYCPARNHCIPSHENCCPNGTHYCDSNSSCIPHHQSCCLMNETYCPDGNHCIPSHENCCPNGTHYCESNSSCIPHHQSCCLMNETYCPDGNHCIPSHENCCPNGTHYCESNSSCIPHYQPCCLMNQTYCPARNNCIPSHENCCLNGTHYCESNSSCIPHHQPCCLMNQTYCPARNNCIPSHENCCLNGTHYCESNSSCIPHHQPCCLMNQTYCPARNNCIPSHENCCLNGTHYCESNSSCIPHHQPCCLMNETLCPARNACLPFNQTCCPRGTNFCESNGSCIPHHMPCCYMNGSFCPARNACIPFNQACCPRGKHYCESNGSCIPHDMPCCYINQTFCPARNDCIPFNETCCAHGKHFCESSGTCIAHQMPCCHMNESFCAARNSCIPLNQTCCPLETHFCQVRNLCIENLDKCFIRFPTVWKFIPLGQMRGVFKERVAAIAIQSVEMFGVNGSLMVYSAPSWRKVGNLSSLNALVVGHDNHLRFMPSSNLSVSHGLILLNYTEYGDQSRIGEYINSTSLAWNPGQTFAIFEFPKKIPPRLVSNGSFYRIAEDSQGNEGFNPWSKFEDSSLKVPTDNTTIPAWVQENLDPDILHIYMEELTEISEMSPQQLYIGGDYDNPRTGKWEKKERSNADWKNANPTRFPSVNQPNVVDSDDRLRFIPAENYFGNLSYEVVGALRHYSNNIGLVYFYRFSPDFQRIFKVLERKGIFPGISFNASYNGTHILKRVIKRLVVEGKEPTVDVTRRILRRMVDQSEITMLEMDRAFQLFQTVYNISMAAKEEMINSSTPSRYRIYVDLDKGGKVATYFMDQKSAVLHVQVTSVNDPPELKRFEVNLEPIPYNFTSYPGNGTLVGDIFSCGRANKPVMDVDTSCRDLGVAVLSAGNGSLGMWEYKMNETSPWTAFDITKDVNAMLLSPDARIRLKLHSRDTIWTNQDKFSIGAFISAMVWDGADGETTGVHLLSDLRTGAVKSVSKKKLTVVILRKGCDGKTDFPGRFDRCGVCRGKDRCLGCDNVPNSGARINKCRFCVGGTTGRTLRHGIDCAGQCGNNYRGPCGVCQDPAKFRNFTKCDGTCSGDAKINRCGVCAGGTTGRTKEHGKDACGQCGGDNSTCVDCSSVPNGNKVVDLCGSCLAASDASFNGGCMKLGSLSPVSGDVTGGTTVTLRGAGFKTQTLAACKFVNSSGTEFDTASITLMASDLKIVVTSPPLPAGQYRIKCQFGGVGAWNEVDNKTFTTYNGSSIVLSSISPNETQIGSAGSLFNVTITGSGFVDTGYLKCVMSAASRRPRLAPAFFVSSTEVLCTFSSKETSTLVDVGLRFGKDDPSAVSVVRFLYFAVQPGALSIQFLRNPRNLMLTLDRPGRSRTQQSTCADFFDADAVQSFGMGSRCSPVTTTKLIIKIGSGATIAPSQYVNFTNGSLLAIAQDHTKIVPGYTTLQVQSPLNPPKPSLTIFGQSIIGPCATLTILTGYSNDGGRDMTFEWYVKPQTGLDANTTADMAALNASLANVTSDVVIINDQFIVRNVPYEIEVRASNFLGRSSEAFLNVTRKQEEVPEIELNSAGGKIKASDKLRLQARALLVGCNSSSAGFLYQWSVSDSTGDQVDLGSGTDTSKSYLRLTAGTLQGGQNYTVKVIAADKSDPFITAEKSIPIEIESSQLLPATRGGNSIDVGITDNLTLDASNSKDPDDPSDTIEQSTFSWECYDSTDFPCFETLTNGTQTRLVLPDGQVVEKAVAEFLNVNEMYKFVLTMQKGLRSATKSIEVRVGACSPPSIDIRPQEQSKINPREIVSIRAQVKGEAVAANITWSSVAEDDLGFVDDLEDASIGDTSLPVTGTLGRIREQANLILKPNSLEPGTYKFRIDVDTGSCSAYSETEIVINSAPSAGSLTVDPSSGTALETEFTFTANGFTDDEEDMPLLYKFSYYAIDEDGNEAEFSVTKKNEKKRKTGIQLPPGDSNNNYTLRVIVEVYDIHGAVVKSETNVTVNPVVFTEDSVLALGDSVTSLAENEDIETLLGAIGPIVSAFGDISGDVSAEVAAKVQEVKEQCVSGALTVLSAVSDDTQGRMDVYTTMGQATQGGASMSDETKQTFFSTFKQIELINESSKRRRRRRSVDSDTVLQVDAYSASQAENTLRSPSNLITTNVYTEVESTRKADFLTLVDTIGQKMCAYLSFGFLPSVAVNPLAVLRADAKNFDNADTELIEMACSDCPSVLTNTAKMLLGNSLKEQFTDWSCLSSETCTWACMLSSQFPYDLLINETSNSSLTDVVDLKFYNPKTYRVVQVDTLSSPVNFWIPLKSNVTFPNASFVECKLWNAGIGNWSTTGCVTRQTPVISGNTTYVECNCTDLGYVSVFVGEPFPVTTQAPVTNATTNSTTAPPVTTAVPAPTEGVNVEFSFTADFNTAVQQAGSLADLTSDVKTSVATELGRPEDALTNFRISSGSIVVQFVLIPGANESVTNFNNTLTALQNQVTNGTFQVTLSSGAVLTADSSSFKVSPVTLTTTAAPTTATPSEESGDNTVIIVACVCGGIAFIVIVAIVAYCCVKKKREFGKISPSRSNSPEQQLEENMEMGEKGHYSSVRDHRGANNNPGMAGPSDA